MNKIFMDGVSKIEIVGATVRLHAITLQSTDQKDKVDIDPVCELIVPVQEFPKFAHLVGQAMKQFLDDKVYTQKPPQEQKEVK